MSLNRSAVQTGLFVRIHVEQYREAIGMEWTPTTLLFSDYHTPFTINEEVYQPLGNLVGITNSRSEIRGSSNTTDITISGIPDARLKEVLASRFKGCPVRIYRAFFDENNELITSTDPNFQNPLGRFAGFVNNFTLQETWDPILRTSSNTILFQCASVVDLLNRKISGRRTNEESQKRFYPTDVSMDRVTTLENTTFDFGAPR